MASRIEIGFKKGIRDALGERIKKGIVEHLGIHVDSVKTLEVYTLDGTLASEELEKAANGPLSDPIIQETAINRGLARGFDWLIEVGFRPGVTDNVGKIAGEAVTLLTGKTVRVYTSRQYAISGIRDRCDL
ncbi:MAG: phosphoribosylformylglycinamidine synthase subunit PurS, partial [Deltaproteobacteria bacterium]